jgi:hypothetical protein
MAPLRDIAGRLAAGSRGRTEADIQADVRGFLLDAPLELEGSDLADVSLEAPAGGGRRIDIEAGNLVIEVKKSLASPTALEAARKQLGEYVQDRTTELGRRYVGILTNGQVWLLHHLLMDGSLVQAGEFKLTGPGDTNRLSAWLESVLATVQNVTPTPREVLRNLGADSPAFALDLDELRELYFACQDSPEVQLKRELWGRLLITALGTNFEDSDELFVMHTYLVLTAELIAHAIARVTLSDTEDVRALLEGQQFALAGIHGVVEADFFDWPALRPEGERIVRAIVRRVTRFDWSAVEHDILKVLYESVIDADTRQKLGEYYTPDWLAERMVEDAITDPLNQRVLDPACGSGTFLFWAVRRVLREADKAGLSNREALDLVVARVSGIDLHPVVVTLARVTYLLALGHERLVDRSELTIPVYLGDSVRWDHDTDLFELDGITIHTTHSVKDDEQDLFFPETVLEDPQRFDRLVADLANRAASRPLPTAHRHGQAPKSTPAIKGLMNRHHVAEADRPAVALVFEKLCRLRDAGRDHLWGYYIRNFARPLSFTRPEGQADVLVGNPPWLFYRNMSHTLQKRYQRLAKARGLWAGGKVAPHQDLSDLFVARVVEQYLRPEGRFAFVMPFGVLSRRQYAGFRTGSFSSDAEGVQAVAFDIPEEFARVKPPLFPMPCCVVAGRHTKKPRALPSGATRWTGRVPDHHIGWAVASERLQREETAVSTAYDADISPYRHRFQQGATVVPRVLLTVEATTVPAVGLPFGRCAVRSRRSAVEKPPWRNLEGLTGVVEEQFVRPMHLGATIVAYRPRVPWLAVVPYDGISLISGEDDRLDEHPGLAAWWREAEAVWEANKSAGTRMTLLEQLDYMGKLHKQFPLAAHRVVYAASGQHIAACVLDDKESVIEHALYWAATETREEALYLCGILNSQSLADAVAPLQSRGQHNPRHFDLHVFALPFPAFDPNDVLHQGLVALAARAEDVAASTDLNTEWQFQKCRRVIREALREDGVAVDIDAAVKDLLAGTGRDSKEPKSRAEVSTPDLMGALSDATSDTRVSSKTRKKRSKLPVKSIVPERAIKPRSK